MSLIAPSPGGNTPGHIFALTVIPLCGLLALHPTCDTAPPGSAAALASRVCDAGAKYVTRYVILTMYGGSEPCKVYTLKATTT
jgi:hypothetical protein